MTDDQRIATTILQQMGGNRFLMMTGAIVMLFVVSTKLALFILIATSHAADSLPVYITGFRSASSVNQMP